MVPIKRLLASLVLLAACSDPECYRYRAGLTLLATFEVGVPYRGWMGIGGDVECLGAPLRVRGAVLDENNVTVPSTWTVSHEAEDGRTQVEFTPQSRGPFHAVAEFIPNLGTVQADLFPASPFQGPRLAELVVPQYESCTGGLAFSDNTLVCPAAFETCTVIVDGGVVGTIPTAELHPFPLRGGDAMWLQSGSELQRRVPNRGAFPITHRTAMEGMRLLAATELSIFAALFDGGQLLRYDVDGGALQRTVLPATVPASYGGMSGDGGAIWSLGAELCLTTISGTNQRCFGPAALRTFLDTKGAWESVGTTVRLVDEEGRRHIAGIPSGYSVFGHGPFLRARGLGMLYLEATANGLELQVMPSNFVSGWPDGDRLLMYEQGKVTVYAR